MEAAMWSLSGGERETILPAGWGCMVDGYYFQPLVSFKMTPLLLTCSLNPCAEPWHPAINGASEADRSLFLTFSNGSPVTQNEIFKFFTDLYGNCVERVYVHWVGEGAGQKNEEWRSRSSAQFGKILFRGATIPQVLTACGAKECKFSVDGKPLWCKPFDSSKTRFYWKK